MKNNLMFTILVTILFIASNNLYADELLSVKAGYQLLSPTGTVAGTINNIGQKIDVEDDLDLDDSDNFSAEIALSWGNSRLSFSYLPIDFAGTGTLSDSLLINDQVFSATSEVKSDLSIDLYDIGYTYYILNADDLPVRFQLGPEVAVKIADAEFSVRDTQTQISEQESAAVAIATLGLRGRIALSDFFGITGRLGYMEFEDNHFLDAEAQIEFSPIPLVGIYAGYRHFDLKIDEKDIYVETKIAGPFAGLMVRF